MNLPEKVAVSLTRLRQTRPLIHQITNYVTINDCANITLAIGASPVMAEDVDEVEEMVALASALVLNMGMPTPRKLSAMLAAGRQANIKGIPVIFDPVGVGATKLRMDAAKRILDELKLTAIRGNLSEIKALSGLGGSSRGVDCIEQSEDSQDIAQKLSTRLDTVVAITGKTDVVACGPAICRINNGSNLLTGVTGTGCMTTSLIASYCSVEGNAFIGTVAGIATMGIAGEIAEEQLTQRDGLGTFRIRLFDVIANLTPEVLLQYIKIC